MSKIDKTIYIVDDDKIFLLITTRLLTKMYPQANIQTFEGGEQALNAINENVPDLLFLDLNMPGMDGWEFLDHVEDMLSNGSFPIYVSTSSINPMDKEKSGDHKMVKGFIEKPWEKESIASIVEQ
jgi:CheY-like chemotaxis protein